MCQQISAWQCLQTSPHCSACQQLTVLIGELGLACKPAVLNRLVHTGRVCRPCDNRMLCDGNKSVLAMHESVLVIVSDDYELRAE